MTVRRGRRLTWILGGAIAALLAVNFLKLSFENPMLAVRAEAERLGHAPEDLVTLGGGYESYLLGRRAHGEFVVSEGGSESVLFIQIARPTPFHAWRLETLSQKPR